MNTYLVTLAAGGTTRVIGEAYNAGNTRLTIRGPLGEITAQFNNGTWTDIAIISPTDSMVTAANTAYQPIITASGGPGTAGDSNVFWTGKGPII